MFHHIFTIFEVLTIPRYDEVYVHAQPAKYDTSYALYSAGCIEYPRDVLSIQEIRIHISTWRPVTLTGI
jgi:hypothetical protein